MKVDPERVRIALSSPHVQWVAEYAAADIAPTPISGERLMRMSLGLADDLSDSEMRVVTFVTCLPADLFQRSAAERRAEELERKMGALAQLALSAGADASEVIRIVT